MNKLLLMKKATLFILIILFNFSMAQASCIYCTSMESALIEPQKVKELDLSAKGLAKLPEGINQLTNLEKLDLSDNQIDEIDFRNLHLPNLKELIMANNPGFNSSLLDEIQFALPELTKLDISNSSLRFISPELGKLKKLEELNLSDNLLRYLPSEIENAEKLRILDLSNNELKDQQLLFSKLWNIENLELKGNNSLNWDDLSYSLLSKNYLKHLSVSSTTGEEILPKIFKDVHVENIEFNSTIIKSINSSVAANESIRQVTFDNCDFVKPSIIYSWINKFKNLETVSFVNMEIPEGIKTISKIKTLKFTNCTFEDIDELAEIKPTISIEAEETNILNGDFIGNAVIGKGFSSSTTNKDLSVYVAQNSLPVILPVDTKEFTTISSESLKIDLGFSSYEIPSGAFLTADGEVYNGEVKINIKEYNDPIQNALAAIPMVYNDGTDHLFSSSGMIDFRAYDSTGMELKPNPENIIQVELSDLQPSEQTKLYIFNDSLKNWEGIGTPISTGYDTLRKFYIDSMSRISDDDLVPFRVVPTLFTFRYKKRNHNPTELTFSAHSNFYFTDKFSSKAHTFYSSNDDERYLCERTWKMDSVHSRTVDSLLTVSKKEQKLMMKTLKKRRSNYNDLPRMITNISITPNQERDNFTLSFNYKNDKYSIPVYENIQGKIETVQRKEKNKFIIYQRKIKKAKKQITRFSKIRDKYVKEEANLIRQQTVDFLMRNQDLIRERSEKLRFGLTSFGLANCDFFSRNIPEYTVMLDSVAIDQHGNHIEVPYEIRHVVLTENTFVSTYERKLPVFKNLRSVSIFAFGALEICIIKGWTKLKNGLYQANVERFSMKNMSPDEVSNRIAGN